MAAESEMVTKAFFIIVFKIYKNVNSFIFFHLCTLAKTRVQLKTKIERYEQGQRNNL
jgi:hypothetical protein